MKDTEAENSEFIEEAAEDEVADEVIPENPEEPEYPYENESAEIN